MANQNEPNKTANSSERGRSHSYYLCICCLMRGKFGHSTAGGSLLVEKIYYLCICCLMRGKLGHSTAGGSLLAESPPATSGSMSSTASLIRGTNGGCFSLRGYTPVPRYMTDAASVGKRRGSMDILDSSFSVYISFFSWYDCPYPNAPYVTCVQKETWFAWFQPDIL